MYMYAAVRRVKHVHVKCIIKQKKRIVCTFFFFVCRSRSMSGCRCSLLHGSPPAAACVRSHAGRLRYPHVHTSPISAPQLTDIISTHRVPGCVKCLYFRDVGIDPFVFPRSRGKGPRLLRCELLYRYTRTVVVGTVQYNIVNVVTRWVVRTSNVPNSMCAGHERTRDNCGEDSCL